MIFVALFFIMSFVLCEANDSLASRIKACSYKKVHNAKYDNCEVEYVPEFVMKNGDLAFQKNYQSCFSRQDSLKDKPQSTFWIYNPAPKRVRIYPTMKPVLAFGDTNADFFILHIDNDKKPHISQKCAYFTHKDKQGKSVSSILGGKVLETHKKFLYFIDALGDENLANLQNYTVSIVFEVETKGFFKADWFFGDFGKNGK